MKRILAPLYYFAGNALLRVRLRSRWAAGILRRQTPTPRGFVILTRDWIARALRNGHGEGLMYREIHPATRVDPLEPKTPGKRISWKPNRTGTTDIPATFVARIPRGRIYGEEADVITPDNWLLADVCLFHPRAAFRTSSIHSGWNTTEVKSPKHFKGRVAVLAGNHPANYYHWMLQMLPRLELFRLGGVDLGSIDFFVLNSLRASFQTETLLHLGIPREKWLETTPSCHAQADELWVTRTLQDIGHQSPWVTTWLRHSFLPQPEKLYPASGRIYISRSDAAYRFVRNEEECLRILERRGFQSVRLQGMPVPQQAALFASAETVVAPHGAGLTNLVFCAPGTRVIELITPAHVRAVYWQLAACVKLRYCYLKCSLYEGRDAHPQDITVDCDLLQRALDFNDP